MDETIDCFGLFNFVPYNKRKKIQFIKRGFTKPHEQWRYSKKMYQIIISLFQVLAE